MKNLPRLIRFRVWLGILILPLEVKKLILAAINPQIIAFGSPGEFAAWLNHNRGIIQLTESMIIREEEIN